MDKTYLLYANLDSPKTITIGKLGRYRFREGDYVYVGSARKNFFHRIERHLRNKKKLHWHIDYLLQHARITNIWSCNLPEEETAQILSKIMVIPVPRFGASDKRNGSHLFYGKPGHIIPGIVLSRVI
jgi:Uri superfamily endonuclease